MCRIANVARLAVVLLAATGMVLLAGCTKPARLLVALGDYCNTPDAMTLMPDGSIILSVPNFNDKSAPPLLMKITPDNKAEPFFRFPTPYPGLPAPVNRINPMGICRAPSGDLYFADLQDRVDKVPKSRLWRVAVRDSKPGEMVLVASGFGVANGVAIHGGYVYVTESVLEEDSHPLTSAVLRFKLGEEGVTLKTPLKDDPHIVATFKSYKDQWRFGADGIAFDSKGNLFVGLFGDGVMHKIEFDKDGNVKSNKVFARARCMITCDGMSCDLRTDKLYLADSAANAIHVISPKGSVTTLCVNGDAKGSGAKLKGMLDQPCEALVRGNTIVVSNMDWPFPKFINSKWEMPATLSVIDLDMPKEK